MVELIAIHVAGYELTARLEMGAARRTCVMFLAMLPLRTRLIHARWSGEACWIPLGDLGLDLDFENHTSHPAPGQLLLYPGGLSETEILVPYGSTLFFSKVGQPAGTPFATIEPGPAHPAE